MPTVTECQVRASQLRAEPSELRARSRQMCDSSRHRRAGEVEYEVSTRSGPVVLHQRCAELWSDAAGEYGMLAE
jgi:hypothetical protein